MVVCHSEMIRVQWNLHTCFAQCWGKIGNIPKKSLNFNGKLIMMFYTHTHMHTSIYIINIYKEFLNQVQTYDTIYTYMYNLPIHILSIWHMYSQSIDIPHKYVLCLSNLFTQYVQANVYIWTISITSQIFIWKQYPYC